ncbi:MAG TPA: polyprenol monophosphomannose synthase [Chitinophagaceae bacterium]|nr:polyprenol monophosphomannose synthase [Chitinophagaceae bacterium]
MKKIVIIPTFNERENIISIIKAVFALDAGFHVLIVDDHSPDGTAELVKKLRYQNKDRLFLLERKGKQGLGTAYIHGFRWSLDRNYEYIFEMDADFSHPPEDLLRLYAACHERGADVSIGSRYVKGGDTENWPKNRILLSKGASLYVRVITGIPIKDATAGFVCYRRKVLEAIDLDNIKFVGYAFQIEMKFNAWKLGFQVVEVPITFTERQFGESKMSKNIIKEGVWGVIDMQLRNLFGRGIRRG